MSSLRASGRPAPPGGDAQRAHLAAGAARHRRRRRAQRLRRRDWRAAWPPAASRSRSSPGPPAATCRPWSSWRPACTVRHVDRRPVRGARQGRPARPAVRLHRRRHADRGPAPRPAGTTSCTPTTGSPARSAGWPPSAGRCRWSTRCTPWPGSRTHALGQRRQPRAGRPRDRRGPGRRGGRPAGRQHRRRGRGRWSSCTTPTRQGRRRRRPASTSTSSARRTAPPRRARLGLPRRRAGAAVRRPHPAAEGAGPVAAGRGRAAARSDPALRDRLVVAVLGGPSGSGLSSPESLQRLAVELGLERRRPVRTAGRPGRAGRLVRRGRPRGRARRTTRSFGLVAVEAQACGTPVVAAAVGGLRTAVADGASGVLVDGHDPAHWRQGASATCSDDRGAAAGDSARGAIAARGQVRLGRPPSTRCSTSTAARRPSTSSAAGRRRPAERRRRPTQPLAATSNGPRSSTSPARGPGEASSSRCPGEHKLRDRSARSWSATTRCRRRRSSSARRTRTTSRSTAGCSSATPGCPASRSRVDRDGDVYLVGRLPLAAVNADELDALLGASSRTSDGIFNELLALGFLELDPAGVGLAHVPRASPPANLEAFRHLLERPTRRIEHRGRLGSAP